MSQAPKTYYQRHTVDLCLQAPEFSLDPRRVGKSYAHVEAIGQQGEVVYCLKNLKRLAEGAVPGYNYYYGWLIGGEGEDRIFVNTGLIAVDKEGNAEQRKTFSPADVGGTGKGIEFFTMVAVTAEPQGISKVPHGMYVLSGKIVQSDPASKQETEIDGIVPRPRALGQRRGAPVMGETVAAEKNKISAAPAAKMEPTAKTDVQAQPPEREEPTTATKESVEEIKEKIEEITKTLPSETRQAEAKVEEMQVGAETKVEETQVEAREMKAEGEDLPEAESPAAGSAKMPAGETPAEEMTAGKMPVEDGQVMTEEAGETKAEKRAEQVGEQEQPSATQPAAQLSQMPPSPQYPPQPSAGGTGQGTAGRISRGEYAYPVFMRIEPFVPPIPNHVWWLISYLGSNQLFGYVHEEGEPLKVKYIVHGLPGAFTPHDQPDQGRTGYIYWRSAAGVPYGYGYWVRYTDPRSDEPVFPFGKS